MKTNTEETTEYKNMVEESMRESVREIETARKENREDAEYVKYVKQFSPEVVEMLLGSDDTEENSEESIELSNIEETIVTAKDLTVTDVKNLRNEAFRLMMEEVESSREETLDLAFSADEYRSFVSLYAPKRIDITTAL